MRISPFSRLTGLSLILMTASNGVYADVLGLTGGKTIWVAELTGESQSTASRAAKQKPVDFNKLALTSEYYSGLWLELEHPLPFVPNIRMSYTNIESAKRVRDTTVVPGGDGIEVSNPQNIDTALAFNNLDATLYYQILDNWVNVDLGLTARKLDGYLDVFYELSEQFPRNFPHSNTELHQIVPMLYGKTQFDIPGTSIYLQAMANGVTYNGDTFVDAEAKVGASLDVLPGLDLGMALGYRTMKLKMINTGNLYADAQIDGFQAEFTAHF